ncbi:hypothetical protein [Acanthopleuribacter pedis]|uniref:Uncharacterized protein n=1 Tax=Acanthopleuribacter pedis TaxID=442870 RepID=A0A8J7U3X4_9BACT|nr:hypothetical protein [Acanthopleuribacter pedis]MBO1320898.1 hypothetical protein [Acanthopleuribacter pedis]
MRMKLTLLHKRFSLGLSMTFALGAGYPLVTIFGVDPVSTVFIGSLMSLWVFYRLVMPEKRVTCQACGADLVLTSIATKKRLVPDINGSVAHDTEGQATDGAPSTGEIIETGGSSEDPDGSGDV